MTEGLNRDPLIADSPVEPVDWPAPAHAGAGLPYRAKDPPPDGIGTVGQRGQPTEADSPTTEIPDQDAAIPASPSATEIAPAPADWRGYALPALDRINTLSSTELKTLMVRLHGSDGGGRLSRELMRRAIAWKIQFIRAGRSSQGVAGFEAVISIRQAEQIVLAAEGKGRRNPSVRMSPALSPGSRLVREWRGTIHEVIVQSDGRFLWQGKAWGSLSMIASAITGTKWSGPRFFGLKGSAGSSSRTPRHG